jgi:hypothetical protein
VASVARRSVGVFPQPSFRLKVPPQVSGHPELLAPPSTSVDGIDVGDLIERR